MTWIKISDTFSDHPKHVALSDSATAAWLRVLAYCGRHLTDGAAPRTVALRAIQSGDPEEVLAELVRARLWTDHGDTIEVHDFLSWNRSRADAERERAAAKARQDRAREKRHGVTNGVTTGESTPLSRRDKRCDNGVGHGVSHAARVEESRVEESRSLRDQEPQISHSQSERGSPAPAATTPPKPRATKAEPVGNPRHREVLDHYWRAFEGARGHKPTDGGRVAKRVSQLLARLDADEVMRRMGNMLADEFATTATIDTLAADPDRFAGPPRKGKPAPIRQQGDAYTIPDALEFDGGGR